MNKNTVLAFILIGCILIGFSVYNNRAAKKFRREQFIADSIAAVEQKKHMAVLEAEYAGDSTRMQAAPQQDTESQAGGGRVSGLQDQTEDLYRFEALNCALQGEESFYTLENNRLKIVFSNKGARPYSVQIKGYHTYSGDSLVLFEGDANKMNFSFHAGQQVSTRNLYFQVSEVEEGKHLRYRLPIDSLSFLEYDYLLAEDSYLLDMRVQIVGMNRIMSRNATQLELNWDIDILRQEKGYINEKNYSTVVYKYPDNKKVENLGLRKDNGKANIRTRLAWVAFQQQYFTAVCVAPDNFEGGDLRFEFYKPEDPDSRLMHCSADLQLDYRPMEQVQSIPLQFYFGPNRFYTLKSYDKGFEKILPLGGSLVSWINRWIIIPTFNFLNRFISNYGIIILILTILLKIVISPLTFKSYMSSAKMRVLKPEIDKINAKYPKKEDALKKQQETMALYKKTGISMFGGCLPMFIQFPILFAMFRFFPASFELRQQGFLWAEDLSAYDSILNLPFKIPLYGDHVSLFALLMAVSMFLYSKMNLKQQPQTDQQMPGMKGMTLYFMPIMMLIMCNNFSSGLSYYYMLSNLLTMLQTWVIRKFFVNEEKLYRKLQARAEKAAPVKKSKWQQRLEEIQRQQQQLQQKQQRRR